MISFVNFARIASICVGFHLGTLQAYFFHLDFWPNLNFRLECQIKLVLNFNKVRRQISNFRDNVLGRTLVGKRIHSGLYIN